MKPIKGVDLKSVFASAHKEFVKGAEKRIQSYLRGRMVEEQNLIAKVTRLRDEADATEAKIKVIKEQIDRISNGDWELIEDLNLKDQEK